VESDTIQQHRTAEIEMAQDICRFWRAPGLSSVRDSVSIAAGARVHSGRRHD